MPSPVPTPIELTDDEGVQLWPPTFPGIRTRSTTSQGSALPRFRRALKTGNLTLIRNAAAELRRVDVGDALAASASRFARPEPERFERAALRWLARFCDRASGGHAGRSRGSSMGLRQHHRRAPALETVQRLCSR